ncbi:hypothetical protein MLD38_014137 [Melastoma candidum]|uniref:Uncharacterized protein n=1 Tax=Melastoma candidum TaxID=119954 RepID=A0ACB9RG00_9MYRT|nr:hypothetical protein MLD38_014137 [Melastoma candidum]
MDFPPPKESSNQIYKVVRLFQILRKWKKLSSSSSSSSSSSLRRAISFPQDDKAAEVVPKGYFVVSVGEGQKRYVVPTRVLSHPAFRELLREAEEVFGFQQKGVLRIPCDVFVFEHVMRIVEERNKSNKLLGVRSRRPVFCGDECDDVVTGSATGSVSSPESAADTSRDRFSPPLCR